MNNMEKLTILKLFIPIAILSSIFSGPFYNLLLFLNPNVLESHWSIFVYTIPIANLMALSFILFSTIFIVTVRFLDKMTKEPLIISAIIIIGYSSIFAGLLWTWEIVILVFLISGSLLAYLIPVLIRFTSNKLQKESNRSKLIFPISSVIWILISFGLFFTYGDAWRIFYFVTGIINICASLTVVFI